MITSSYTTALQADGRERVTESHLLADGRIVTFEYLADAGVDKDAVLSLRAERVRAEIAAREEAAGLAAQGSVALTKLQFRRLFTPLERASIDAFNAGFEGHPALTDEQKAGVRTALADYAVASDIRLDDEATIAALYMYEALGLIASGRAAEIIGG